MGLNIDKEDNVFIPVISIGELYFGAELSEKRLKYVDDIEELIFAYDVLDVTKETCKQYRLIRAVLRRKGKPIPENDIWISAIALQYNLILATRDGHFDEVDGLLIEKCNAKK